MIDESPTFGNWFEKMKSISTELLENALPAIFHRSVIEVSTYFIESFGNATRIDYGHSHELAFIMFLCALYKIFALDERDNLLVGLKIFNAYLQLLSVKEPFEPNRFLETDVINRFKNEYYFIGCIDHIRQVKTGSFTEHSNQLVSIGSFDSWGKINSILIFEYEKET
ncbi:hypothetical protein HA402_010692 [Bradysia odoriphaga]|nr:hypothetical protein HA402_010692 [Bradysia odoriphaga]